jgi:hypothetical protein
MTLTCGVNGLYPCPVCLVPKNGQSNLMERYPKCTTEDSHDIYKHVLAMKSEADKERILKTRGIHLIEV